MGSGAAFIRDSSVGAEKGVGKKLLEILIDEPDYKKAIHLIEGISAKALLADRDYDTNDILAYAVSLGIEPVIPPKKNRKEQLDYDKCLYKLRHLVENCFLTLKNRRGIVTRAVHVRCIVIWADLHAYLG